MPSLDIIIPIKDRVEVRQCVSSLLNIASHNISITLCDGGTSELDCVRVLQELNRHSVIRVIHCPMQGFNKAKLLNQGIRESQADLILISDADIIWNSKALGELTNNVLSEPQVLCYVRVVKEAEPTSIALKRKRYYYSISTDENITLVVFSSESLEESESRPGYGLVCSYRTTFQKLGGYKEIFTGWGWEDQDLLIRAEICGIPVYKDACVMHISHPDTVRNRHCNYLQPSFTRDNNIITCAQSLSHGIVLGDLYKKMNRLPQHNIRVHLPDIFTRTQ